MTQSPTGPIVYVFLSSADTHDEVLEKGLVGTTWDEWNRSFRDLPVNGNVLVYNYDTGYFHGPFGVVEHHNGGSLDRSAFRSRFPCQARIRPIGAIVSVSADDVERQAVPIDLCADIDASGHRGSFA